tara:strand:+ start:2911 stop:3243 length:333 start_codon:yes stop_codon:yes gene_type:complete
MNRSRHQVHCSAEGCKVVIGRGKLFCEGHYYALPKGLRDGLWDAWRQAMDGRDGTFTMIEQAMFNRDYQAAFETCVMHLRTAPMTSAVAMTATAIAADGREVRFVEGRQL